jgi:hypothetical protein
MILQSPKPLCHLPPAAIPDPTFFLAGSDGGEQWATRHQQRNCKGGNKANMSEVS